MVDLHDFSLPKRLRQLLRRGSLKSLSFIAALLGVACTPAVPLSGTAGLAAESPQAQAATAPAASLYERLGGLPAITAVVDDFIARLHRDPVVRERFEAVNTPRFRAKLIEQIGELSGGPQKYTGIDMRTLHTGMDVTEEEFNAVVGDLTATLEAFRVPDREKGELLNALGSLKDEIVAQAPTIEERLGTLEGLLGRVDTRVNTILDRLNTGTPAPAASPKLSAPRPNAPRRASEPPSPQAWTDAERMLVPGLIERYERASRAANVGKRRDLVGRPLAYSRFLRDDGTVVDLNELRGQRVVLIIMRGFAGAVCLHCSTQMLALVKHLEEFKERNTRVFVVYPGDAGTVPVFIESVRALDARFRPPFPLLLDVDLAAVRAFLIEGSVAKPTTMILDNKGIVRWAYVGQDPADRPSIELVLRQLDQIKVGTT